MYVGTVVVSVVMVMVASEVLLRLSGYQPWRFHTREDSGQHAGEPITLAPDAVRGWRNKEGVYTIPAFSRGSADIRMTFLRGGVRDTGASANGAGGWIMLVGGSFTEGRAVSDRHTFAWKLQERFKNHRVINYGTAGYGTYQAMLTIEQVLRGQQLPYIIVYGLNQHHEKRNVATGGWLASLTEYSRGGIVHVPYVTLDASGDIVRHAPARLRVWPLAERLSLMTFVQRTYTRVVSFPRTLQRWSAMKRLLMEMDGMCRESGIVLVVVLLLINEESKYRYIEFLNKQNIKYVDCTIPWSRDAVVVGEWSHPNEKTHQDYADCITDYIARSVMK